MRKAAKDYREMAINAHQILSEYFTFDDLYTMPIYQLLDHVNTFLPRMREIARRKQAKQFENELAGKKNHLKPGGRRY